MDAKLIVNENGEFTIGITDGDLTPEDGFDTAINISLFTDQRAPADRINQTELRRGWLGDTVSLIEGRQIGSLLWLLDQSRLTPDTRNDAISFSQKSLNWLVEDGLATLVEVTGVIVPRLGIELTIVITNTDGVVTTHYRKLWELTGNGN